MIKIIKNKKGKVDFSKIGGMFSRLAEGAKSKIKQGTTTLKERRGKKKKQAEKATPPPQQPVRTSTAPQQPIAPRRPNVGYAAVAAGGAAVGYVGGKALKGAGKSLFSTELPKNMGDLIRELFKPISLILSKIWKFLFGGLKIYFLVIFVLFIMFGLPLLEQSAVYAAEVNGIDNSIKGWAGYIGEKTLIKPAQKMKNFFEKTGKGFEASIMGAADPNYNQDQTRYGIYIDSGNIGPARAIYYLDIDDQVTINIYPQAEILSSKKGDVATINCELEYEYEAKVDVYPSDTLRLIDIPGKSLSCTFPLTSEIDKIKREATVSITYPFTVSASLGISVMRDDIYQKDLDNYLSKNNYNIKTTKDALAKSVGVDSIKAGQTQITPVLVGFELSEYQPIPTDYPTSLRVDIYNMGEGLVTEINELKIDVGDSGLEITNKGVQVDYIGGGIYQVKQEELQKYKEIKYLQPFTFTMNTNNFKLDPDQSKKVTTRRINVEVTYTYEITASTDITVYPCLAYPNCEEEHETRRGV